MKELPGSVVRARFFFFPFRYTPENDGIQHMLRRRGAQRGIFFSPSRSAYPRASASALITSFAHSVCVCVYNDTYAIYILIGLHDDIL